MYFCIYSCYNLYQIVQLDNNFKGEINSKINLPEIPIGIDLGTTYCCIGFWNTKSKQVEIISSTYKGKKVTIFPSYLHFKSPPQINIIDKSKLLQFSNGANFYLDNFVVFGHEAKDNWQNDPLNTTYNVKRLIGRKYFDDSVVADKKYLSYNVKQGPDTSILIHIQCLDYCFTPTELSAIMLYKMKKLAETYLQGIALANKAIITVPAYFQDSQRKQTKAAGEMSGFEVLRVLNEPTAASISYGLEVNINKEKKVLIYDLGGGTFDISLLHISHSIYQVLAVNGDTHLGGEDFDNLLLDYIVGLVNSQLQINIKMEEPFRQMLPELKSNCEILKKQLSQFDNVKLQLPPQLQQILQKEIYINRKIFNDLCLNLFQKTLSLVTQTIQSAGLKKEDITDLVLVGGSTRILLVKEMLRQMFNKVPYDKVNPDEAVGYGAGVQASISYGIYDPFIQKIKLLDVVPLSLGIGTNDGKCENFIQKNTKIPVQVSKIFYPPQNKTAATLSVYEGERWNSRDNYLLGKFQLINLQANSPIDVIFDISQDGILTIMTNDSRNVQQKFQIAKQVNEINIKDKDRIEQILDDGRINEVTEKQQKERYDLVENIKALLESYQNYLNQDTSFFNAEEKQKFNQQRKKFQSLKKSVEEKYESAPIQDLQQAHSDLNNKYYKFLEILQDLNCAAKKRKENCLIF